MDKCIIVLSLISVYLLLLSSNADALQRKDVCPWMYYRSTNCLKSKFLCSNGACVDKGSYCNGINDCGDNTDEKYCYVPRNRWSGIDECSSVASMTACPESTKCIPSEWFCDGVRDCHYGEDEKYCDGNKDTEYPIKTRALRWLSMQKQSQPATEMWGSLVDKSAVAFYLADNSWTTKENETRGEMAYEVSIQLLSRLSKSKLRDIPSSDLASYVNAFLVTCLNPRKFHGLDIVQELRTRVNSENYTDPFLLFSLCNAGDTITFSDETKLLDAFWSKYRILWTDTQAVAVMALACASKQPGNEIDSATLSELLLELKLHQYSNGTVQNLQTTALVMQALLSAEPDSDSVNFDVNKALQQITAMQKSDGSFGSLLDTYYVLPVLNCKSLVNISSDHCESPEKDESSALEDLTTRSGPKTHIRYSLWIGNNKDLERNIALRVPVNMSFYGIMEMAAEIDSRYRFEYVVVNNKPYVNALSGLKDNPEKGKFWFLYTIVEGKPSPSQESPSDLIPKENEHFVMWYRTGSWIQQG